MWPTCFSTIKFRLVHFFFLPPFAVIVAYLDLSSSGQPVRVPTCACVPAWRKKKKKKKGERAVTERKRSAISACGLHGSQSHSKLPSGFACMVLVSTTLFIGTFRLRRITASNRVCALRADAYFSFSHAVSYHQKQRELGINIIVRTVPTGSLRGLNLICW